MRKRYKTSEMPFAEALAAARKRLALATKELEQAQKIVRERVEEIPLLQSTVNALDRQLDPSKIGQVFGASNFPTYGSVVHEVEAKYASAVASLAVEPTEDELLPDPEGTELLPE